jgi:hypothetical protein
MPCSTGCRTKNHASLGECLRSKNVRPIGANMAKGLDMTARKAWDKELDLYESAARQGVQPKSTKTHDIRQALDASDHLGTAFDAT